MLIYVITLILISYSLINSLAFVLADQLLANYYMSTMQCQKLDEGDVADVILFDFSKAFDVVSHVTGKIEQARPAQFPIAVAFIFPYWMSNQGLCKRRCVRGETSNLRYVKSGVPRGSIFGHLLFLVYINNNIAS